MAGPGFGVTATHRRAAVVSGGGTGIGRAVARTLAAEGADVTIIGRREEVLKETADALNTELGAERVRAVTADLREPDAVAAVAERIAAVTPVVDVLVNNAGGNFAPVARTDLAGIREDWAINIAGNVLPTVLLTHALRPALRRPGARIITITSIAAFRGPATYGGSKAALHSWAAELTAQLAPEGITVNCVAPGYVADTEFYGARMNGEFHAGRARQALTGNGGVPEDVAGMVAYLAAPGTGHVTGQVLQINGGALLGRG
jgi:3-oxoacyl-[acyl-carrier protein] reductase